MERLIRDNISNLRVYLKGLPDTMPIAKGDAATSALLFFSIDDEWAKEEGEEATVNRALECALFDFGPLNDQGIFKITTRGGGLDKLPDVLEFWLEKLPNSLLLQNWLQNAVDSAFDAACLGDVDKEPVSEVSVHFTNGAEIYVLAL